MAELVYNIFPVARYVTERVINNTTCNCVTEQKAWHWPLGEGAHDLRVVHDEGWTDTLFFKELSHQLKEKPRI